MDAETSPQPAGAEPQDGLPPCPACAGTQLGGDGWVVWCPACGRGVVPKRPHAPGRFERWRDARRRRVDDALVDQLTSDETVTSRLGASFVVAALVHLLTLACLIGGLLLSVTTWFEPISIVGLLLVGLGVVVRPRIPRATSVLDPAELPAFAGYVEAIAAAVGCSPPDAYVVNDSFNAGVSRVLGPGLRPTTVLYVGRPLWGASTPEQRTALLAHELGHAVAGDPGRHWWIGSAERSLREWGYVLRPTRAPIRRRPSLRTDISMFDAAVNLLLAPLSATIGLLTLAYSRVVNRHQRRCELIADRVAAAVAGSSATAGMLRVTLLRDVVAIAISSARAHGDTTPTMVLAARAARRVPADELIRRSRREELIGDTGDRTHPPAFRRIRLVEARAAAADVDIPADVTAMDAELERA